MEEVALNVKELATMLGVAPITVYKMVENKTITHTRIGTRIVFFRDKVDEWINQNTVSPKLP